MAQEPGSSVLERWIAAPFFLLFLVLIVTFADLYRSSREVNRVQDRLRSARDLDTASTLLGQLLESARKQADGVARDPEVINYLEGADEMVRARAIPKLRLERFVTSGVKSVEIVRDGDAPVVFREEGFAPLSGPSDAFAPEPEDPLVERARGKRNPGEVAAALVTGASGPRLRVALAARLVVVVVETDATETLAALRKATAGSQLALLDARGAPQSLVLADPEAVLLAERADVKARTGYWSELEEQSVIASVDVRGAANAGGWRLVSRAPITVSAIRFTILRAAVVMAGLLALALYVMRLQVRNAAGRERETAVRRSLDETAQNERFLQSLFDAITDVVVVQDANYRIIRANRVAKKLYGADIVGRACYEVYRGQKSNARCTGCPADRTVADKGPVHVVMRDPRTDEVWEIANYPVLDERGQVKAVVEHARNITDTRRLEQQLVQTEKLSTLGEMAAGVAHEINNPIGVISMFAQLLSEEVKDVSPDAFEKARTIEKHAELVGAIVKDLLRFARKGTGEHVPVDARAVVERALSIVEHQKMLREVQVEKQLSVEPAMVLGDEGPLAQVVLNLMLNAVQAMEGKGTLTLIVRRVSGTEVAPGVAAGDDGALQGERVWIQVKDTGAGIAPRNLRRIFEPFFTTKPAGQGTGLGLSVSFGIVTRDHRGRISVASEEGKGALFTVELPAAPVPGLPPAQEVRSPS